MNRITALVAAFAFGVAVGTFAPDTRSIYLIADDVYETIDGEHVRIGTLWRWPGQQVCVLARYEGVEGRECPK